MSSIDPSVNTPKVADNMFGDDMGFLSGLWISFDQAPVVEKKKEKEPVEPVKEPVVEEVVAKPIHKNEDIEPVLKEARVISREEPKKPSYPDSRGKARTKEKTKTSPNDAVGQLIQQKTKEQQDLDRTAFVAKKPFAPWARSAWWYQGTRPAWGNNRPNFANKWQANNSGKITIWSTQQKKWVQNNTPNTPKEEKTYKVSDSLKKKETISIGESITVKEFSEKMGVPLWEVIKVLLSNKILVGATANIDFDTAMLIATEFEISVEKEDSQMNVEAVLSGDLQAILESDKGSDNLITRPPVVTIMGHVDHGKTRLLDYFRKSNVVGWEAWGITQSIWASQVIHNGQKITFVDTPWHELFTSLRARGSKITDIVIIVVAADDGVKQQTVEAINHAKDSGVPIIVAITKIDLGTNRMDDIKGQLWANGLQPEERWGDVMLVPCSSVTGQGIDDLLDAVLLQYEMLERKYNPKRAAVGVVVEARKDSKQWVTTSLLIMTGTLRVGDIVVIHNTFGKVRRMTDRSGKEVKIATGGDPVMILWLQDLPEPGRVAEVVNNEKEANKKIELISTHESLHANDTIIHNLLDKINKGESLQLKVILKADSFGSLEAVKYATSKVECPPNIEIVLVHADVGAITDSDILFAQAAKGIVVGYNVDAPGSTKKKATQLHVPLKSFDIIYQYIDYLTLLTEWMIEKEKISVSIGKLEILAVFFRKWKETIFGGKVIEGKIKNNSSFKVTNRLTEATKDSEWGKEISWNITSLQRDKDNVNEVAQGYECGMKAKVAKKLEVGDILEFFVWEEK